MGDRVEFNMLPVLAKSVALVVRDSCGEKLTSAETKEEQRGFGFHYICGYCEEDLDNQDIAEDVYDS